MILKEQIFVSIYKCCKKYDRDSFFSKVKSPTDCCIAKKENLKLLNVQMF